MIAFLLAMQERRIEELEATIGEAIVGLEATRDQFQSAAIAEIRRMLKRALNPPEDEEN
jgi:uncharacterized coiled-coil protein SlyX